MLGLPFKVKRMPRRLRGICRRHRDTILVSLFIIVLSLLLLWVAQGAGKTLWDFVELLIIPAVLGIVAWLFNRAARKRDREIESDRQRQAVLTTYFDQMADLLLKHDLGNSKSSSKKGGEVRSIARARTLSALRNLDGRRKGQVLLFLYESGLIDKKPAIDLKLADLQGAELVGASLEGAHLSNANLRRAHLSYAKLEGANLVKANLAGAHLSHAKLQGAELYGASLRGADMGWAKLQRANLMGVIPKGFIPDQADIKRAIRRGVDLKRAMLNSAIKKGIIPRPISPRGATLKSANLEGAEVTPRWLDAVQTLDNAIMPDGTEYEDWKVRGKPDWTISTEKQSTTGELPATADEPEENSSESQDEA